MSGDPRRDGELVPRDGPSPAPEHGGDADVVSRAFGIPAAALLDFSASVNPGGPPAGALGRLAADVANPALLTRYPDPDAHELRSALAAHAGVRPDHVVVANGSSALIGACVRAVAARSCVLPVPAFGEYRRVLDVDGCAVVPLPLRPDADFRLDVEALCRQLREQRPSLCILTNPHAPTGALIPSDAVRRLIALTGRLGGVLLVDEAFGDYVPEQSIAARVAHADRLIVLRSVTKFYGMPALRIGYAVASPAVAPRLVRQLPPWPVSRLAADATVEAVRDTDYAATVRAAVTRERPRLVRALQAIGLHVYPSAANFLLIELPPAWPDSSTVRRRLIVTARILVRDCRGFEGLGSGRFIRLAVRTHADNQALVDALAALAPDRRGPR